MLVTRSKQIRCLNGRFPFLNGRNLLVFLRTFAPIITEVTLHRQIGIYRRLFVLAFLWPAIQGVQAQPREPYQTTIFGTRDGLPHNAVHALCQDRNGYLWIGTEAGLSRYNGYQFEHFLQAKDQRIGYVRSLFETPDGILWIGTETGIFMAIHGRIHPVSLTFGGKYKQVRDFLWDDKQQRLWFACASGPFYFTNQQISILKKQPDARDFFPASQVGWSDMTAGDPRAFVIEMDGLNRLWVGNANSLFCCDARSSRRIWQSNTNDEITCMTSVGKDTLYFGGNSSTLFGYLNGKVERFADSMYYVTDLLEHNGEHLFFSAGEMYRITPQGMVKIWDHNIRVGVSDVIVDRENNVWVATWEGLVKISPRFFEQMPVSQYPALEEIYGIGVDAAGLPLFGANHGKAYQLTGGAKPQLRSLHTRICPNANINDFYTDALGRQWIATEYEGLAVLESGQLRRLGQKDGLHDEGLFRLLPARNGDLWAIGDGGVSKIELSGTSIHQRTPRIQAIRFVDTQEGLNTLTCGVEDPLGGLWFGGNRGLYQKTARGLEEIPLFPDQNIMISGMSLNPSGLLWIATLGNGLICCSWNGAQWQPERTFTEKDGLFSGNLLAVLADSKGRIWIGYGFGIGLLEFSADKTWHIRYFNDRDGFFPKGCHRMQIMETPSGRFWVASPTGVCHFRPDSFTRNEVAPIVRIREVQLFEGYYDYKPYCDSLSPVTGLPEHLVLPYSLNNLHFVFDGLSLTNPDNNRFRFRLAGADESWRTPQQGNLQVTYPKLGPGTYSFYVEVENSDGVRTQQPAVFHFEILAPFWQKTGFWALIMALFVAMTIMLARNRIRRIRRQESEKTAIQAQIAELKVQALRSQINPHFIFNCLAGIQECVLQEQFMDANDYLTRFARLLRLTLERSDKTYISLPQELEMLLLYLELENTRLGQQINYQINSHVLEHDSGLLLPTFIIQPFVENAIWHGLMHKKGEKQLKINISIETRRNENKILEKKILPEENILVIEITDNGIGRVRSTEIRRLKIAGHQSKGIRISEERLKLTHQNASVQYKDLYDDAGKAAGTSVRIEIPIKSGEQA